MGKNFLQKQGFPYSGKGGGESEILMGGGGGGRGRWEGGGGGHFLPAKGTWGVILTIQTFFKAKNSFPWMQNIN